MAPPTCVVHLESSRDATRRLTEALAGDLHSLDLKPARSEQAVLDALKNGAVDVVIFSGSLSKTDVSAAIRRLRSAAPDVPLVALLDYEDPVAELDLLNAGAAECVGPSRANRLGWAVRRALNAREEGARRELVQKEINSLESQLQHAQRLSHIARLASGVAHDFNNLLTVINGCCQLLLRSLPEDHEARALVEPIEQAGTRGAELTKRLLSFSRQEPAATTFLNLNDLITEVQPILVPLLGERVKLSLNLDPSLWLVRADAAEMTQVLLNLLTNARDAMRDGGTVAIRTGNVDLFSGSATTAAGSYVELVVRDSGCGMKEEVRARIFDPFFTTKPDGQGTGLGLSMVQRVVAQSGGEIDVETAPGRGTTMRLRLPRAERADVKPQPRTSEQTPVAPGTETVLVVEDEVGVRGVLCGFLRGSGYRVLEAEDAAAATALCGLQHGPIDLLISDVVLPGESGPRLAARLKEMMPTLKTLFISGYPADALSDSGFDRSASFLPKPFSRESLLQNVRRILGPGSG